MRTITKVYKTAPEGSKTESKNNQPPLLREA